jgi:AsmA protein
LTGALFDGPLSASGRLDATGPARFEGTAKLENADLGHATRAATGKVVATGRMAADARLTTGGQSVAAMVSALDGSGSVALTDVETAGAAQGTVLAPLLALFDGLRQIGGLLGQGAAMGAADFSATYTIDDGVVRSEDMRLNSGLGDGTARGFADLPAWRIDVNGEMQLARNVLTDLVTGAAGSEQAHVLPFWLRGPLDAPDVKVDTSSLTGAIRIPGLDKLGKKKGVGKVLEALTGRPSSGAAQPQPTGPSSADEGTPDRRQSPLEDVLKGLLKNR